MLVLAILEVVALAGVAPSYQVEGSFFKIPKTFTIFGEDGREISHITKEPLSLLPRFTVDLRDGSSFYIRKKLTLLRDKYDVDNLGLRIEGNIWDLDFQLLNSQNQVVARIQKELFHLTSTDRKSTRLNSSH